MVVSTGGCLRIEIQKPGSDGEEGGPLACVRNGIAIQSSEETVNTAIAMPGLGLDLEPKWVVEHGVGPK